MSKIILSANTDWYLYNFRLSLARYLRDQGFEILLVSPPGKYTQVLRENGFRWIEWNLGRQTMSPWRETGAVLRLYRIYRRERPELVHHHTIKPVLYGSLAARLAGVPGVINSITGRGYIFIDETRKARILRRIVEPLYNLVLNSPHCGVIFENETDQGYFLSRGLVPPERSWLIQGVGVDPERFSPAPEPEGAPVILLAARMLWDKGVGVLVQAARILHPKLPVRVILAGEPDPGNPATVDLATLERWHEEGVVEYQGFQSDMHRVYQQSHIVTLPTMYGEGVPTTLLEGAACGRPLVASDVPGCRHVVIDGCNGYLVPPNDPQTLAEALERLARDKALRDKMGAAARKLILEKFTQSRINAATLDVYRHIIADERTFTPRDPQ
jgi:glycosyltransferase involved in cell wall biosynthesis